MERICPENCNSHSNHARHSVIFSFYVLAVLVYGFMVLMFLLAPAYLLAALDWFVSNFQSRVEADAQSLNRTVCIK